MKKRNYILAIAILCYSAGAAMAQIKIKDGTVTGSSSSPVAGAILEVESNNKGLLFSRVNLTNTTTWGLAGSPAQGMMVYDTAVAITSTNSSYPILAGGRGMYYWDGAGWVGMKNGGNFWAIQGNAGTNPAGGTSSGTDFLGTTDAQDFQIKVGSSRKDVMRVLNGNGHTQFGNWLDLSNSPNLQNADRFLNGLNISSVPSVLSVAANYTMADLSGTTVNNLRSGAYVNATSSVPFFSNFFFTQFNNGYTGAISGNLVQLRLDGSSTYAPSGSNFIAGDQSIVTVMGGSTATTAGGTIGVLGTVSNATGAFINGPVYAVKGRTTTAGVYSGPVVGAQGSIEAASSATYNSTVHGTQGIVSSGLFNGTTIGAEGSITGGTFAAGTSAIGLHSSVSASGAQSGYGLYIEDIAGLTRQYGVYQAGSTDSNYFAGKVGIASSNPNSTLQVNGSVSTAIATTAGSYTLSDADYTVIFTGAAIAPTFTLPDPTTCKGRMYRLINASGSSNYQDVTLSRPVKLYTGNSTTTLQINTFTTGNGIADPVIGNSAIIQSDGASWWRVGL